MGIGGSGLSGIAQIAASQGYAVTGCDQATETPYLDRVKASGIPIFSGHSPDHLQNIDLLAVSPAIFYQNNDHPEISLARSQNKVIKWQDFMGQYLQQDKFVIAVAGTHGKSTTTALVGLLLEAAKLDPTVELGATVPAWDNTIRLGTGQYFVCEADEFHDNFATYHPKISLLTMVEYDHPEYFGNISNMLEHYQRFIDRSETVIYNADSPLISQLKLSPNSIPYHLSDFRSQDWPLGIAGVHNQQNALAVINLAHLLKIPDSTTQKVLSGFHGLHRRLELLGSAKDISIYDDYANHPTSFQSNISTLRQLRPSGQLWVVIEPHTFSRLRVLKDQLPNSVALADHIIVSKIYPSREQDPGDFSGQDIVKAMNHPQATYIPDFDTIVSTLKKEAKPNDTILVMGSGNSYHLSRQILSHL